MKTIQLQVEDDNYESFLTIIKSLKKGMVKNLAIKEEDCIVDDFEQTKIYFQNA